MQQVLITGGAGFIGANFVRYLQRHAPEAHIVNLDALTYAGSLENLRDLPDPGRHTFVHGDVGDATLVADLLRTHEVDTIVHFAAESHVDRSIAGPSAFVQTNVVGTFTLLEAARRAWSDRQDVRFHHVSTDEVYGTLAPDDPAFSEHTAYDPRSPYAATKAASDHLVRAYYHTYRLPVTLTNCSNNYGPYQFPEKLIPLVILRALRGQPLPLYGDGQQVRDWLYVEDHCAALYAVLTGGTVGETYNIGGNNQPTNLEIVQVLCRLLDDALPQSPHVPHARLITFVKDRPGHDRRYAMDIQHIGEALGWTPTESLASGLRKTVQWYLQHPGWIDAVQEGADWQAWMRQHYENRETL